MSDLVPGVQIAGPGELTWAENFTYPEQGVVTISVGAATFQGSGQTVATSFSADGWWVFDLPGFQRAHTRLRVDAKTGGEAWLVADWADGMPQRVTGLYFVKPTVGAGFGSVIQASRIWQAGPTVGTNEPLFYHLYQDGTGEQVQKFLDTGLERRLPFTSWGLDGANLWTYTKTAAILNRLWVPLRNQGAKKRWVMESYESTQDGVTTQLIKPRVTYFVDTGEAIPPAN